MLISPTEPVELRLTIVPLDVPPPVFERAR